MKLASLKSAPRKLVPPVAAKAITKRLTKSSLYSGSSPTALLYTTYTAPTNAPATTAPSLTCACNTSAPNTATPEILLLNVTTRRLGTSPFPV